MRMNTALLLHPCNKTFADRTMQHTLILMSSINVLLLAVNYVLLLHGHSRRTKRIDIVGKIFTRFFKIHSLCAQRLTLTLIYGPTRPIRNSGQAHVLLVRLLVVIYWLYLFLHLQN